MYHPAKIASCLALYLLLIVCSLLQPAVAVPLPFTVLARAKAYKGRPAQMVLYQYDDKPLGRRAPLLFVHGLKAEFCPCLRWQKLVKHLIANPEFSHKYKIFFVRYDSRAILDGIVPQLQAKIAELYDVCNKKPVTIIALSMGGNIVYDAMLQPETDKQVQLFLTMATPFHGSPLFSYDWLQYTIYKNMHLPITRIDHSLAYRMYFADKSNLLTGLCWDNCDQSIPNVGHFASVLPFGPKGNLTVDSTINKELVTANQKSFDKDKIIAYGGFLVNHYHWPAVNRFIEETFMLPYNLLTMTVPAHFAREHPVLKMLNRQISIVATTQAAAKRCGTNFVFDLNDGITPIGSALFLPDRYCATTSIAHESDLVRIKPLLDVHTARVFRNIDHISFLDGYRPIASPSSMPDELNPQAGKHNIFDWILLDLDCMQPDTRQSTTVATYN